MDDTEILEDGEINEPCEIPTSVDRFLVSRQTREPQTICSDESSSDKSDESDDDSDNQCSRPKKVRVQSQPPVPASRSQVPSKYKVWSIALQEEALMENLHKCDVDAIEHDRSVESYNYKIINRTNSFEHIDDEPEYEHQLSEDEYVRRDDNRDRRAGNKRRHGDIKKRLGSKKKRENFRPKRLPSLSVTVESSEEDVAKDIAIKLQESKQNLILNVVLVLGKQKAIELYNETKGVEEQGGMLLMTGERRRTSGGVFLLLLKRDDKITADDMKNIFSDHVARSYRVKRMAKRRRTAKKLKEFKETLIREKLLNLNATMCLTSSDTTNCDAPPEPEGCDLEEGEVEGEPTVTNPPPSPATDQDTSPSHALVYSDEEGGVSIEPSDNTGRTVVSYEDSDDDYLNVNLSADDMDVF